MERERCKGRRPARAGDGASAVEAPLEPSQEALKSATVVFIGVSARLTSESSFPGSPVLCPRHHPGDSKLGIVQCGKEKQEEKCLPAPGVRIFRQRSPTEGRGERLLGEPCMPNNVFLSEVGRLKPPTALIHSLQDCNG